MKINKETRELLQEVEAGIIQIECQIAHLRTLVGEKLNRNNNIRQNDKS